jgi:hypothetical protein
MTMVLRRRARNGAAILLLCAASACSGAGGIGDVLGSVLGGGQQAQAAQAQGSIRAVDSRSQQISLQLTNGQTVALAYDNQTKVVYQNQLYSVSNLESGDEVVLRVRDVGNGTYYTDSIHVTRSVSSSGGGSSGSSANVQSLQGTVRQIDRANGLFSLDAGNVLLTVSMPYGATRADVTRFQNLRPGDNVRFYGVFLNNTRVELRQFY